MKPQIVTISRVAHIINGELANNRLQWTGTLKAGRASKVLFRSAALRKEFRPTEPGVRFAEVKMIRQSVPLVLFLALSSCSGSNLEVVPPHKPQPLIAPEINPPESVSYSELGKLGIAPPKAVEQKLNCYDVPNSEQRRLYSRIVVTFSITESGAVEDVKVEDPFQPPWPEYISCLKKAVSHWKFIAPNKEGKPIRVENCVTVVNLEPAR